MSGADLLHRTVLNVVSASDIECWLRVREVPGSIPSQGPRHIKDDIKMVPCLALNIKKVDTGSFRRIKIGEKKCNG